MKQLCSAPPPTRVRPVKKYFTELVVVQYLEEIAAPDHQPWTQCATAQPRSTAQLRPHGTVWGAQLLPDNRKMVVVSERVKHLTG